jgi:hypothetical protein
MPKYRLKGLRMPTTLSAFSSVLEAHDQAGAESVQPASLDAEIISPGKELLSMFHRKALLPLLSVALFATGCETSLVAPPSDQYYTATRKKVVGEIVVLTYLNGNITDCTIKNITNEALALVACGQRQVEVRCDRPGKGLLTVKFLAGGPDVYKIYCEHNQGAGLTGQAA